MFFLDHGHSRDNFCIDQTENTTSTDFHGIECRKFERVPFFQIQPLSVNSKHFPYTVMAFRKPVIPWPTSMGIIPKEVGRAVFPY
jgi:hypothetical protein